LLPPDYSSPFNIYTDSSEHSVGARFTQEYSGKQRPIAFASSKLTDVQRRWLVIEKETYATIFALKIFDTIVYGYEIVLYSDHNPRSYLVACTPRSAKLVRWSLSLHQYLITVKHCPGKYNLAANGLSRL